MEQILAQLLVEYATKYPIAASIIMVVGVLRLVFKPTFSWLRVVADATPTSKDNALLDKAEASGIYKAIVWVVDWLGSIKLPGAK